MYNLMLNYGQDQPANTTLVLRNEWNEFLVVGV